jgi:hypothetical protein
MRARVGPVPRDRLYPFVSGQEGGDAGPSIMMDGTDVRGFPMMHSSENSQKFIETIDEPDLIVEIHSNVNRDG